MTGANQQDAIWADCVEQPGSFRREGWTQYKCGPSVAQGRFGLARWRRAADTSNQAPAVKTPTQSLQAAVGLLGRFKLLNAGPIFIRKIGLQPNEYERNQLLKNIAKDGCYSSG